MTIPAHATSVVLGLSTVQDLTDEPNGTVTVTITLSTDDDGTDESNAFVTARVSDGEGYVVGGESTATVTIKDNDRPAVPTGLIANGDIENGKIRLRWFPSTRG